MIRSCGKRQLVNAALPGAYPRAVGAQPAHLVFVKKVSFMSNWFDPIIHRSGLVVVQGRCSFALAGLFTLSAALSTTHRRCRNRHGRRRGHRAARLLRPWGGVVSDAGTYALLSAAIHNKGCPESASLASYESSERRIRGERSRY